MGSGNVSASAEHPDELGDAFVAGDFPETGDRPVFDDGFFDEEMAGGEAGHLREVGDGNDLVFFPEIAHFESDGTGDFSADIGVDFIEYE